MSQKITRIHIVVKDKEDWKKLYGLKKLENYGLLGTGEEVFGECDKHFVCNELACDGDNIVKFIYDIIKVLPDIITVAKYILTVCKLTLCGNEGGCRIFHKLFVEKLLAIPFSVIHCESRNKIKVSRSAE